MNVNAPARPLSGTMDVDEFMAFLETRPDEERWDLIEGVAVMMAPPSVAHQRIVQNLCGLLNTAFAACRLDLFAYPSLGVRMAGVRNFQPQPDVVAIYERLYPTFRALYPELQGSFAALAEFETA